MSISLDAKVDLMLALLEEQSTKLSKLTKKYGLISDVPKWVTTSELAEITKNKTGTITNWIYKGKIPSTIIKKVTKGKCHKYLINGREGVKAIECIKQGIEYVAGGTK